MTKLRQSSKQKILEQVWLSTHIGVLFLKKHKIYHVVEHLEDVPLWTIRMGSEYCLCAKAL